MTEGFVSVTELAEKWGITSRRIQVMCAQGIIKGAIKNGRNWEVPVDIERPVDVRVTTGEYRNWRKS